MSRVRGDAGGLIHPCHDFVNGILWTSPGMRPRLEAELRPRSVEYALSGQDGRDAEGISVAARFLSCHGGSGGCCHRPENSEKLFFRLELV